MATVARNDPCPCGSGNKYKQCCMRSGGAEKQKRNQILSGIAVMIIVVALALAIFVGTSTGVTVGGVGLALLGGYWLFTDPPAPRSGGNPGAINFGG